MSAGTGKLAVSFSGLDGISNEIAAGVTALQRRLDALEQDLVPLKSDWTGEAANAYQQAKMKWDGAIADLKATLNQTGTAVQDSRGQYMSTENKNASAFGG
jgi:early secretory antigenic target protein ESAT-6